MNQTPRIQFSNAPHESVNQSGRFSQVDKQVQIQNAHNIINSQEMLKRDKNLCEQYYQQIMVLADNSKQLYNNCIAQLQEIDNQFQEQFLSIMENEFNSVLQQSEVLHSKIKAKSALQQQCQNKIQVLIKIQSVLDSSKDMWNQVQ